MIKIYIVKIYKYINIHNKTIYIFNTVYYHGGTWQKYWCDSSLLLEMFFKESNCFSNNTMTTTSVMLEVPKISVTNC